LCYEKTVLSVDYAVCVLEVFVECGFFVLVINQIVKNIIKSNAQITPRIAPTTTKIPSPFPSILIVIPIVTNIKQIPIMPELTIHVINDALGSFGFFFNLSFAPYIHKITPGIRNNTLDTAIIKPVSLVFPYVNAINNNPANKTNMVPAIKPIPIHQNLLNFFISITFSN
jgi:hypothetical protein